MELEQRNKITKIFVNELCGGIDRLDNGADNLIIYTL